MIGLLATGLALTPLATPRAQTTMLFPSGATTSFTIPFADGAMNYTSPQGQLLNRPGTFWLSLNSGPATKFVMDTGSSGIIASPDIFPASGPSLGRGSQVYTSSGIQLNGDFYLTPVSIMNGSSTVAGTQVATAMVVALQATSSTCIPNARGCTPNPNPTGVAYMGVGFDRGSSAITPPGSDTRINPFININSGGATYQQGYIVSNTGVTLGLTNANINGFSLVKLTPNPSPAGQQSATWLQAPMTITVGGITGSGQILPDSGISYAFLAPPTGANISTSACPNPPGGSACANTGLPVQVFLPGQSTPQLGFYNFTVGGTGNPLQPELVQIVPGTVFLNTGREFFAGFNYLFDPINGYVGYQWNGSSTQFGNVIPMIALQGNVNFTNAFSTTMPTWLMGNTAISASNSVVFNGSLFGPGSLSINSGDVWLANPINTYTGGTIVNGGTLTLASGASLPFAGALTMNGGTFRLNGNTQVLGSLAGNGGTVNLGNGLLVLNSAAANSFGGALAGSGTFTLQGSGSLNLTGNSTGFGGSTVVSNASLSVNGSLGGNVFVGSGGTVGGNGTIVGNLFNGGTVAPGNSVGLLTIAGNYSQNSAGVYVTEVFGSGSSDRINVGGTATLGGTVVVSVVPGLPLAPVTTYTILNAQGGINGTFASVNELYPFLQSSLSYDANNVYLTLQVGGFAAQALTNTQYAVGAVLDASAPNATGDFAAVLGTVATATVQQGQAFMQALSGNNYAGFSTSMVQGAQLFMNNFANQTGGGGSPVSGRVALAEACDVACDPTAPPKWGAWGGALGGLGTVGAQQPVGAVTYNVGGVAVGLDRLITDNFRMGITTGYSTGTQWVSGFDGLGRSNTFQVGLYGGFAQDKVYADAVAGYAYTGNQMWRNIAIPGLQQRTAYGQAGANQWYGQLETGYRFDLGGTAQAFVTPFARLQAYTGTQNGFTETGAQSLNLTVNQQTTNSLRTVLGAQLGGAMDMGWREKLAMQFRLGWSHEYADVGRPVTATLAGAPAMPFTTFGVSPQRDGVVLGLSANTAVADATSIYLRYEGDISGQDNLHAITAGVRMTW